MAEQLTVLLPGGAASPRCAGVLEAALAGCRFDRAALDAQLAQALGPGQTCEDLRGLLAAQDL